MDYLAHLWRVLRQKFELKVLKFFRFSDFFWNLKKSVFDHKTQFWHADLTFYQSFDHLAHLWRFLSKWYPFSAAGPAENQTLWSLWSRGCDVTLRGYCMWRMQDFLLTDGPIEKRIRMRARRSVSNECRETSKMQGLPISALFKGAYESWRWVEAPIIFI